MPSLEGEGCGRRMNPEASSFVVDTESGDENLSQVTRGSRWDDRGR